MSFDSGSEEVFDIDRIKAALKSELLRLNMPFEELCHVAGLTEATALRALERGSEGFPETVEVFQRLSVALGRDPNYLLYGVDNTSQWQRDEVTRVRKLVFEYIYKANVIQEDRPKLLAAALEPLTTNYGTNARYRSPVVMTLKDVLLLHRGF